LEKKIQLYPTAGPDIIFLNNNQGYNYIVHIHGGDDFGFGITSTSYIEGL